MKTLLVLLSLLSAAEMLVAAVAEALRVAVPTALDPVSGFTAFGVSVFALIAFTDYSRTARTRLAVPAKLIAPRHDRAEHALAA